MIMNYNQLLRNSFNIFLRQGRNINDQIESHFNCYLMNKSK